MDSLPDYGMAPSKEIWAERHVRRHAVRENLEAERLYGVNDNPICFAEAQFIRYLVEHGLPETPLINMLRLTNNRLRSSDDREPSSDNAYEAGLQFRHGMQGYFAQQDIVDDNAPIAFTFYVEAPQPLMGNRVEVGKECLIGESGTQVEPYVKIDAKRNLDPQEIARLQGLFRSANQSAKKIVGIEQLYVEHEAKYCINPSTNEMVTELTLQYVDQAGNVYLPRKRTVRADAMEAQTLVSFLRSNPNQVLTSVDT
jgi:hypothetical protein